MSRHSEPGPTSDLHRQNCILREAVQILKLQLKSQQTEKQELLKRVKLLEEQLQLVKPDPTEQTKPSTFHSSVQELTPHNERMKGVMTSRSKHRSRDQQKQYTIQEIYPDIRNNPAVKHALKKRTSLQNSVETGATERKSAASKDKPKLRTFRQMRDSEEVKKQSCEPPVPVPADIERSHNRRKSYFDKP